MLEFYEWECAYFIQFKPSKQTHSKRIRLQIFEYVTACRSCFTANVSLLEAYTHVKVNALFVFFLSLSRSAVQM